MSGGTDRFFEEMLRSAEQAARRTVREQLNSLKAEVRTLKRDLKKYKDLEQKGKDKLSALRDQLKTEQQRIHKERAELGLSWVRYREARTKLVAQWKQILKLRTVTVKNLINSEAGNGAWGSNTRAMAEIMKEEARAPKPKTKKSKTNE